MSSLSEGSRGMFFGEAKGLSSQPEAPDHLIKPVQSLGRRKGQNVQQGRTAVKNSPHSYTVKRYNHFGKQFGGFLKS